jgi:hypothetical protein
VFAVSDYRAARRVSTLKVFNPGTEKALQFRLGDVCVLMQKDEKMALHGVS